MYNKYFMARRPLLYNILYSTGHNKDKPSVYATDRPPYQTVTNHSVRSYVYYITYILVIYLPLYANIAYCAVHGRGTKKLQ